MESTAAGAACLCLESEWQDNSGKTGTKDRDKSTKVSNWKQKKHPEKYNKTLFSPSLRGVPHPWLLDWNMSPASWNTCIASVPPPGLQPVSDSCTTSHTWVTSRIDYTYPLTHFHCDPSANVSLTVSWIDSQRTFPTFSCVSWCWLFRTWTPLSTASSCTDAPGSPETLSCRRLPGSRGVALKALSFS